MFELPYPPTINNYYAVVNGRKILSSRGRTFKSDAIIELFKQGAEKGLEGPYSIWIQVFPPDRRKRDIDNLVKPVLDSLTEFGMISDDSQVTDLRVTKYDRMKGGGIKVLVNGGS